MVTNSTYRRDKPIAIQLLLDKAICASLESTLCEKNKSVLVLVGPSIRCQKVVA
jgi:hypothetical protein